MITEELKLWKTLDFREDVRSSDCYRAVFGDTPGQLMQRPDGDDGRRFWLYALGLAGQGFYARAHAALDVARRDGIRRGDRQLGAAVAIARGSHLRQNGRHAAAAAFDGAAAAIATDWLEVDALVGLAADRLGLGDNTGARRLLDRAEGRVAQWASQQSLSSQDYVWATRQRAALRLAWVGAEWAIYSQATRPTIDDAIATIAGRVRDCPSVRHRVKSDLITASAQASSDEIAAGAYDVAIRAHECGLLPLEWAGWRLFIAVTSADGDAVASEQRTRAILNSRGGNLAAV